MRNELKFSAIAAAVGLAFSGTALANSAGAPVSIGAGASAVKTGIVRAVIGTTASTSSVCGTNPATIYDNNSSDITSATVLPGGSIFRIVCGTNDMSYDTAGGSWKSFTSVSSALYTNAQNTTLSANPVSYVASSGTASAFAITGFKVGSTTYTFNNPVSYNYGAAKVAAVVGTDTVDFGMADAETVLFSNGANQPLIDTGLGSTGATGTMNASNAINTPAQMAFSALGGHGIEISGFPYNALGITFGIAVSSSLYHVLQVNQGIGGTCLDVPGYTNNACAPNIPLADVKALLSGSTAASLLTEYAPIEIARRDQGSGTNAATNAFLLNVGCSATAATAGAGTEGTGISLQFVSGTAGTNPGDVVIGAGTNYFVTYQESTGNVLNRLTGKNGWGVSTDNVIGYVSTENDSAGKLGNATSSSTFVAPLYGTSASFVKIDGVYPSAENSAAGAYNFTSTEVLHCGKNTGSLGSTICTALKADFNSFPTGGGLININNSTSDYGNNGNICSGWQRVL